MKKAYSQIMLAAALWGIMGLFVRKLTSLNISRMQIGLFRVSVAYMAMMVVLLRKDKRLFRVRLRDIWCFVGTGVVSLTFMNLCYFTSMQYVPLSVASVLVYAAPAIVMLLSAVLFDEKITVGRLRALALVFGGCIIVTGLLGRDIVEFSLPGVLYGLGAGLSYAMYSIFGRFALKRGYHTFTITFYTFLLVAR